ncbi:MAG: hypothetical protein LH615_10070 [Ferruginibacter sp.]|nr:hypothetical protein [Ferruginibacter sp.]
MKKIISISIALFLTFSLYAQKQITVYRYVVKFNSECCGVPDAAPLLKSLAKFKKKNYIKKLSYYKISPMGKEGEYYMAFQLKELTEKKLVLFMKEIDATVLKMKDKGSASTEENMVIDKQSLSSRTTIKKPTL